MAATYGQIANNAYSALNQLIDDREIEYSQVVYWTLVVADRVLRSHLIKQGVDDQRRSGKHMTTFVLDIAEDPELNDRRYISLPGAVFDFDLDAAIDYMVYYMDERTCGPGCDFSVHFTRTTPKLLGGLGSDPYTRPGPRTPYFYREGDRLYLCGIKPLVHKVEVGLIMSSPSLNDYDPDKEFSVPGQAVNVERGVIDLGRWVLMMPNEKLANDGSELAIPPTDGGKVVSVNDPLTRIDSANGQS